MICKFIDANFTKENNVQLLANVINESQTDVVAIQELDSCNTRNNYFQLKSIAESCGTEIKKLYGESKKPIFLGGDMNAYPNDTMMAEFRKDWTIISQTSSGTTVENSNKPCIDYILQLNNNAKPAQIINSAVITESNAGDMKKASDHYAVYVDVKL